MARIFKTLVNIGFIVSFIRNHKIKLTTRNYHTECPKPSAINFNLFITFQFFFFFILLIFFNKYCNTGLQ